MRRLHQAEGHVMEENPYQSPDHLAEANDSPKRLAETFYMSPSEWAVFLVLPAAVAVSYLVHSGGRAGWMFLLFIFLYFPAGTIAAWIAGCCFVANSKGQPILPRVLIW